MNRLKQAKYSIMNSYHNGTFFELPAQYKKNPDIAKLAIMRSRNNARQIASIFGEFLNYHEATDQAALEIIIMLKHMLTTEQKNKIGFYLYEQILETVARNNLFEELYNTYKNKTVLHYLLDRQLDIYFATFKSNRESAEAIIVDILNNYDPVLSAYLTEHSNILNKYVIPNEKKLTI